LKNFVEVTISLDTANPENYLQIRRMNFFNKVVENLKLLVQRKKELKLNTRIFINSVISHLNYKEIDALIELAKKLWSKWNWIRRSRKLENTIRKRLRRRKKICSTSSSI